MIIPTQVNESVQAHYTRSDLGSLILAALEKACRGKENVMPPILSAVRAYATIGEISDVMRGVFGVYRGKVTV